MGMGMGIEIPSPRQPWVRLRTLYPYTMLTRQAGDSNCPNRRRPVGLAIGVLSTFRSLEAVEIVKCRSVCARRRLSAFNLG